jgi:ABC-type sugar transport system permease subunit
VTDGSNPVTIRDIDVPFWRIVTILVKWSIASIPAMIVLMLLLALVGAVVAGVLGLIGLQIPDVPTPTSDAPLSP